jgi:hypothetical protein
VDKPGYQPSEKEVDVQPGTATTHSVNLELVNYAVLRAGGAQSEGARLSIDGAFACTMPCEKQIPAGDHQLAIEKEGMENYHGKLSAGRAEQTTLDVRFSPKPPKVKAWTEAVFSGLFMGGGIYLAVLGKQVKDDIERDMQVAAKMVPSNDSRKLKGSLLYIGADVMFGASVVTGLLSLWNFLESGPPSVAKIKKSNLAEPDKKVGFVPVGMPGGLGLAATGRF